VTQHRPRDQISSDGCSKALPENPASCWRASPGCCSGLVGCPANRPRDLRGPSLASEIAALSVSLGAWAGDRTISDRAAACGVGLREMNSCRGVAVTFPSASAERNLSRPRIALDGDFWGRNMSLKFSFDRKGSRSADNRRASRRRCCMAAHKARAEDSARSPNFLRSS
jgi:hypothetical protein